MHARQIGSVSAIGIVPQKWICCDKAALLYTEDIFWLDDVFYLVKQNLTPANTILVNQKFEW